MKIKLLTVLMLSAVLMIGACNRDSNTNTNANANRAASTPLPTATQAVPDATIKSTIENGWKTAGCTGATVDVMNGVATLRGTVPKGKLGECVMVANQAKPMKVDNQLVEGK